MARVAILLSLGDESMTDPHLRLAGFSLRVLGREFPHLDGYWDGNWLVAEACFEHVAMRGPFLHADEIATFAARVRQLDAARVGSARLECTEPNLALDLTCDAHGCLRVVLEMRPDPHLQRHAFELELDGASLGSLAADLEAIVTAYPVRFGGPR